MPSSEILCVGEMLWDSLPAGLFLGGAPFNVACHLRAAGVPVAMVSRVGTDHLGDEAFRRAARYGVVTDLLQLDQALPTGLVRVAVDDSGNATYEIVEPAAWDAIAPDDALLERSAAARAIVFGSLAQRNAVSRRTIERMWDTKALMVFDANLRPPHDERGIVRRSLQRADVVKVNDDELRQLASWFDLGKELREAAADLAEAFACRIVCVTRGSDGAAMWRDGKWTEHPGFEVEVRDTVGAGDAFLAVMLTGLLNGVEDSALVQHANLIAAYVATQSGAVPADQPEVLARSLAADRPAMVAKTPADKSEGRQRLPRGSAAARRPRPRD